MGAVAVARRLLPPTTQERAYALITTVDSLGTGCFLAVSVVLFVRLLAVSPSQIGAGLGIGGLVGLLGRVPLGRLADRIGHRRSLIAVHLARAVTLPCYLFVHGFLAFTVVTVLVLLADGWESPIRKVVLYAFAELDDRVRIAAYNRSVYNLAFALGSLLGALALTDRHGRLGLYLVVLGNAGSFLLAAALATRLPAGSQLRPETGGGPETPVRRYALVGLLLGTMFLCTSMLTIGVPLLVLRQYPSRPWLIGLAMALNTAVTVLLQVRLSRGTADTAGAGRVGAIGGATLSAAGVLFFLADRHPGPAGAGVALLLVAVLVLALGDLQAAAATWGLSSSLRSSDVSARSQSIWSMYNSLPPLAGPFLMAWSLHRLGSYGWLLMAALIGVAALLLRPVALVAGGQTRSPTADRP